MRPTHVVPLLVAAALCAAFWLAAPAAADPAPASRPDASQPTLVGAPTLAAPVADAGVPGAWKKMKDAFKSEQYRKGIGFLLTILVFLWRRFLFGFVMHRLSPAKVGVLTVALAFVGTLPTALLREPFSWGEFVWDACVASGEAMLLWQLILKRIPWFKVPEGGKAAAPAASPTTPDVDAAGPVP